MPWELADLSGNRITGGDSQADLLRLLRELRFLNREVADSRYAVIFYDMDGTYHRYRLPEVLA